MEPTRAGRSEEVQTQDVTQAGAGDSESVVCCGCGTEFDAEWCPKCFTEDGRRVEPTHWINGQDGPRQVGGINQEELRARVMRHQMAMNSQVIERMRMYGGSFAKRLAEAAACADAVNLEWIKTSPVWKSYEKSVTEA